MNEYLTPSFGYPAGDAENNSALMELECSQIRMGLESRPRTNGLKFNVSVGGLYLRDKMNPDSIMPVLVAPQQRVSATIGPIMIQYMCVKMDAEKSR